MQKKLKMNFDGTKDWLTYQRLVTLPRHCSIKNLAIQMIIALGPIKQQSQLRCRLGECFFFPNHDSIYLLHLSVSSQIGNGSRLFKSVTMRLSFFCLGIFTRGKIKPSESIATILQYIPPRLEPFGNLVADGGMENQGNITTACSKNTGAAWLY